MRWRVAALIEMSGSAPLPVTRVRQGEQFNRTLAGTNKHSPQGGGRADRDYSDHPPKRCGAQHA
jgi:hypothetical protein